MLDIFPRKVDLGKSLYLVESRNQLLRLVFVKRLHDFIGWRVDFFDWRAQLGVKIALFGREVAEVCCVH